MTNQKVDQTTEKKSVSVCGLSISSNKSLLATHTELTLISFSHNLRKIKSPNVPNHESIKVKFFKSPKYKRQLPVAHGNFQSTVLSLLISVFTFFQSHTVRLQNLLLLLVCLPSIIVTVRLGVCAITPNVFFFFKLALIS